MDTTTMTPTQMELEITALRRDMEGLKATLEHARRDRDTAEDALLDLRAKVGRIADTLRTPTHGVSFERIRLALCDALRLA